MLGLLGQARFCRRKLMGSIAVGHRHNLNDSLRNLLAQERATHRQQPLYASDGSAARY